MRTKWQRDEQVIEDTSAERERLTQVVTDAIYAAMLEQDKSIKEVAEIIQESDFSVVRALAGGHNFNLDEIADFSVALNGHFEITWTPDT